MSKLENIIEKQEQQVATLEYEVDSFKSGSGPAPSMDKLVEENLKLKYQVAHLERAIKEEEKNGTHHLCSTQSVLIALFGHTIQKTFPSVTDHQVLLTPSSKEAFGDYQCNSAMSLSKVLKSQGENLSPRDVAQKLIDNLPQCSVVEKVEIAGPGFINIFLTKDFVCQEIRKILLHGVTAPKIIPKKVVIDYSSPNIAKEMHVGHLRSTIIGDSIANLCEFLGHKVVRLNHIGDWGTQFGMLITHLMDTFPDCETTMPCIADLQAFYKASKTRFDADEEFKKRAYVAVVSLQSHEEETTRVWEIICELSRIEFLKIYSRLNIGKLIERGESFYQDRMDAVVAELQSRGMLVKEEGRMLMWPPGGEIPLTVVKSDGGYTYDTSDLAAIKQRLEEEAANWIIYVVDMGQSVHFKGIFSAAQATGWFNPDRHRVDHVGFGVVLGQDRQKLKTRSGEPILLVDLLDEGLQRSLARLKEKERDKELSPAELKAAQEAVAYGCIKYADLSHNRTSDYIFSFDKMLEDKGNTAVYLLYAYTRISSIARNANLSESALRSAVEQEPIHLDHAKEWKLGKALSRFPDVLLKIQEDLMLHSLCDYLYELATTFTEFYDVCYCIERSKDSDEVKINMWRILLCEATAKIMKTGFRILGLKPVQRM